MSKMSIDIVSDVTCPWCIIGYKNLEKALAELPDINAEINWHAFEINPDISEEGENNIDHIMHKYGISREQSQQNRQNIVERGLDAGFRFNLSDDSLSFNTFNLHRLLFWAKAFNKQTELKIAFFYAHFAEGKQLNQKEDLLTVIKSVGLNTEEAEQVLSSNEFETEVRAEQNHMHQMGVNSVPSFIINQKYLISGGQPSEAFKQALTQINSEQPA